MLRLIVLFTVLAAPCAAQDQQRVTALEPGERLVVDYEYRGFATSRERTYVFERDSESQRLIASSPLLGRDRRFVFPESLEAALDSALALYRVTPWIYDCYETIGLRWERGGETVERESFESCLPGLPTGEAEEVFTLWVLEQLVE